MDGIKNLDIRNKLLGCYLGKSVGGTLGMPYEGIETFLNLRYYMPIPEKSLPNDDIDLQLVWLEAFKRKGPALSSEDLAECWAKHIDAHPDEYGIANWNIRRGLKPPFTGLHNNEAFKNGMGGAIRSEIWASLFAGKPRSAAYYAWQDASVDHYGEGVYGEVFLAAAQAHLYGSANLRASIDYALRFLPDEARLKIALQDVERFFDSGATYEEARERAMRLFGSVNFTDVVMNLCSVLIGLLYGRGDFSNTITMAVNCGQDTDCTGATAGAFLGILLGKDGIPEEWSSKVGMDIAVGDYIKNITVANSIEALVEDILACRKAMASADVPELRVPFRQPELKDVEDENPWLVEGERTVFGGFKLDSAKYGKHIGKMIHFKTDVSIDFTGDIQLMIASRGLFSCTWEGRFMGSKGDMMHPVPAIHRVRGGRRYNLQVEKGRSYALEIALYPTFPVPDLYVAFADMNCRHLDVSYQTGHEAVASATESHQSTP